jgi:hypothetical protein
VLDVGGWTFFRSTLEEFDRSATALATKLGVVVVQGVGDGLDLPERLIASGGANTATLDFTFVEPFTLDYCHD